MSGNFGLSTFFRNFVPNKNSDSMQYSLILKPAILDTARLQPFIAQAAEAAGIGDTEANRLRLAVEEAVANVINYGQASAITLLVALEADRLVLTIEDDGLPFDPTQGSSTDLSVPADQRPPGGLGIILMQRMSDSLSYLRIDGRNVLRIEKKRNRE